MRLRSLGEGVGLAGDDPSRYRGRQGVVIGCHHDTRGHRVSLLERDAARGFVAAAAFFALLLEASRCA